MARPPLMFDKKDARFVDVLIRHGVPAFQVARELGIDEKTLSRHFGEVIVTARAKRRMQAIDKLWDRAEKGSARALIQLDRLTRGSRV